MTFDDLSVVCREIGNAQGLPNRHYIDDAVFRRENETLLCDNWAGLTVASDVPDPGDAMPMTFLGMPLLLIRDKANQVRVFQNTCRHRGMILVDEPRKVEGVIRCPYHSWCYATTGELVTTPHVGGPGHNTAEGIDRATLGLVEIRSHVWMDVVWINVSGNADPFEEAHASLLQRWREFDHPVYHGGTDSRFVLDVNCNWKLAVENYCESYHLPWVHPGLNSYSRLEDHYHIEEAGRFSGQGTSVYRQIKSDDGATFPDFPDLSDTWDTAAEYIAVYPNVLLGVHRDHTFAILLVPQAPDRTLEQIHIYYPSQDTDTELRKKNAAQWKEVFVEDIHVVEGMQRGRYAPKFDGGRFSPAMDGPTHMFHTWVAGQMATTHAHPTAAE